MKLVAEILSTSMETETDREVDTITANKEETSSVLPMLQDASTQASAPKMKSVSVTVRVKGKDKGNIAPHIKIGFTYLHIATETEKPPQHANVAIQCDLLAAPPLQKLAPSAPQPSLDDSFLTETEQDTDADVDVSFTCSQDYTTEYVYINKYTISVKLRI